MELEKELNKKFELVPVREDISSAVVLRPPIELDYKDMGSRIKEGLEQDPCNFISTALASYWDFFVNLLEGRTPVIDDHIHGDKFEYEDHATLPEFLVSSMYGNLAKYVVLREANKSAIAKADAMWERGTRELPEGFSVPEWELEAIVNKTGQNVQITLSDNSLDKLKMIRAKGDVLPVEVLANALYFYNDRLADWKNNYSLNYESRQQCCSHNCEDDDY